jgi:hypothetical protein
MDCPLAKQLAEKIYQTEREEGGHLIPHQDIRKVLEQVDPNDERFDEYRYMSARLSSYWHDILGYCSRARELCKESLGELEQAREILSKGFLDWYPEFAPIWALMTGPDVPALAGEIALHEGMRSQCLRLLDLLLAAKANPADGRGEGDHRPTC